MNRPPARPPRLGVHVTDGGVDVAVVAPHAEALELCLLDDDGGERRVPLHGPTLGWFVGHVPGVEPGQRYGFRAHGPWEPAYGLRYNPAKLLVDPYARGLVGDLRLGPEVYGHAVDDKLRGDAYGAPDPRDSAGSVPHSVVVDTRSLDGPDPAANRPWTPWQETVFYEAHVRGLTMTAPHVPDDLRGTYLGLAHPSVVEHLLRLGVTALDLLPIHAFTSEPHLVRRGMANYWGYNTLGFFAPHAAYATAAARAAGPAAVLDEVRTMVHTLHEAGLEVILDVVYNHTCEGGTDGPHLSWRGLDNALYYLHDSTVPTSLVDVTGTGNTLDFRRPEVVRLAMDSLRYWAEVVGVDGFRFDLAVATGRGHAGFTPDHPFLVAATTDPALHALKMIAEPWDLGTGGWRTGQFPLPFGEWNDRFRNAVRSFWLADPARASKGLPGHRLGELATRLSGSVDLFGHGVPPLTRTPAASVNYVTAHDGFTLADLVSYDHKHNAANGEQNRDGSDDNRSWNHGVEGPVAPDSPGAVILPLRHRSMRNLFATLVMAAGTPLITAGDEMGRSQSGNNNAYCQDNAVSWVSWDLEPWQQNLLATATHLLGLRRAHPALRTRAFFTGEPVTPGGPPDLAWFTPEGNEFDQDRWHDATLRTVQMARTTKDGDAVLLVVNGSLDQADVKLADAPRPWELAWDSAWDHPDEASEAAIAGGLHPAPGEHVLLEPLSMRIYVPRV